MLTESAKSTLNECNQASYKITPQGLEFSIDAETQKALRELQRLENEGEPVGFHTDELFLEVIEHCLCNGLSTVRPEDIGALTDSMLFSEGGILDDHGNPDATLINESDFYWFPNYQVRSPIEDLTEYGKVIFTTN